MSRLALWAQILPGTLMLGFFALCGLAATAIGAMVVLRYVIAPLWHWLGLSGIFC